MDVRTAEYNEQQIRFLELPPSGLLLNTKDVCMVLGIIERPEGDELADPSLDLTSAVLIAAGYDDAFAMWLHETFAGYDIETLVGPPLDDDWTNVP